MEIDVMAMANKLVVLRGKKTQDEVAKDLGISRSALCMYESGKENSGEIPLRRALPNIIKEAYHLFFLTKKNTKCVH